MCKMNLFPTPDGKKICIWFFYNKCEGVTVWFPTDNSYSKWFFKILVCYFYIKFAPCISNHSVMIFKTFCRLHESNVSISIFISIWRSYVQMIFWSVCLNDWDNWIIEATNWNEQTLAFHVVKKGSHGLTSN